MSVMKKGDRVKYVGSDPSLVGKEGTVDNTPINRSVLHAVLWDGERVARWHYSNNLQLITQSTQQAQQALTSTRRFQVGDRVAYVGPTQRYQNRQGTITATG